MILTRSPYYKVIPWQYNGGATADSIKLQLFIWDGDVNTPPATPTYEITKQNLEDANDSISVDIARLIKDYIISTPIEVSNTSLNDGNAGVWVKHQVIYTIGISVFTNLIVTDFATLGYGYGNEGMNYQPDSRMLTDSFEVDASYNSIINLPIVLADGLSATVRSYPSNKLNKTFAINSSGLSSENISSISVNTNEALNERYIDIDYDGQTFTIFLTDECKNTPIDIQFTNRYGAIQNITFFKEKKDSLSVEREEYESDRGQPNLGNHQFKNFNVNGRSKFTLKTGNLDESQNNLFKELLLSESVWMGATPLNVGTTSIEYKTRNNDKLVSYEVEFINSYNEINTL